MEVVKIFHTKDSMGNPQILIVNQLKYECQVNGHLRTEFSDISENLLNVDDYDCVEVIQ